MGIIIKASAIQKDITLKSSIKTAGAAAKECIINAQIDVQEIDILINIGVFRDNNMVEPAMAAMIQKEAGINLDYVLYPVERHAFSFDLINGPCGFLNAVFSSIGFLKLKKVRNVMIVSSNAHPSNIAVQNYPFTNIGAAMILSLSEDDSKGFNNFSFKTSDGGLTGMRAFVDLSADTGGGRDRLTIEQDEEYHMKLHEFTAGNVKQFMNENKINPDTTKLITSQLSSDFSKGLARELGYADSAADNLFNTYGDPHTSSLILGYHIAETTGSLKNYDAVLFVNSGSGLTTGCSLYRL